MLLSLLHNRVCPNVDGTLHSTSTYCQHSHTTPYCHFSSTARAHVLHLLHYRACCPAAHSVGCLSQTPKLPMTESLLRLSTSQGMGRQSAHGSHIALASICAHFCCTFSCTAAAAPLNCNALLIARLLLHRSCLWLHSSLLIAAALSRVLRAPHYAHGICCCPPSCTMLSCTMHALLIARLLLHRSRVLRLLRCAQWLCCCPLSCICSPHCAVAGPCCCLSHLLSLSPTAWVTACASDGTWV